MICHMCRGCDYLQNWNSFLIVFTEQSLTVFLGHSLCICMYVCLSVCLSEHVTASMGRHVLAIGPTPQCNEQPPCLTQYRRKHHLIDWKQVLSLLAPNNMLYNLTVMGWVENLYVKAVFSFLQCFQTQCGTCDLQHGKTRACYRPHPPMQWTTSLSDAI